MRLRRTGSESLSGAWCTLGLLLAACNAADGDKLRPPVATTTDNNVRVDLSDGGSENTGVGNAACRDETDTSPCALPNGRGACFAGVCRLVACDEGFVDCDRDHQLDPDEEPTGCEATLDMVEHCGVCNAPCKLANAKTSCTGQCRLDRCEDGFGDCDDDARNGCETPLDTTRNCGACGEACEDVERGTPACIDGKCGVGKCDTGYGDCDGELDNGCETELVTDTHCGECDRACDPANATGTCHSGACIVEACDAGRFDCNGLSRDGCEADLVDLEHCGGCGMSCDPDHAARPVCADTADGIRCEVDHGCPEDASNCTEGAPENGCEDGYADCDEDPDNGCETPLNTLRNCQECGNLCRKENAVTTCSSGTCKVTGCEPGYGLCGDDGVCMPLANDPLNCGACGLVCASGRCHGGKCTDATCAPGTADCNNAATCETNLTTSDNCGLCGRDCGTLSRAVGACVEGKCAITSCSDNYADCDGVVSNGCETDLRTLGNCGACGAICTTENAQATCEDLSCKVATCDPGRADCNRDDSDGCETDITLAASCGACDVDCQSGEHVVGGGCGEGVCTLTCERNYADCDRSPKTGCEADLTHEQNCGECGVDCTALPKVASAACHNSGCRDLVCEEGFGNCDGLASNGCETDLKSPYHCGACDTTCAPARGVGSCDSGQCRVIACDRGFDDCNGEADDGCEASLAAASSCGECDAVCARGLGCENGQCACRFSSQCPAGQECCDGRCFDTDSVCRRTPCLTTESRPLLHCESCGNYCPTRGDLWCCASILGL